MSYSTGKTVGNGVHHASSIPADQVTPTFSVPDCEVHPEWAPSPTYTIPKFSVGKLVTIALPPVKGKWIIGGDFYIHVAKRPRWLTRKLMWWLVEWKWEDA